MLLLPSLNCPLFLFKVPRSSKVARAGLEGKSQSDVSQDQKKQLSANQKARTLQRALASGKDRAVPRSLKQNLRRLLTQESTCHGETTMTLVNDDDASWLID